MQDKLKQFLDTTFAPYGDFPAREEVLQELLTNLQEKYQDLKAQDKTDDEAYNATIDSFGDVAEMMDQLPHNETKKGRQLTGSLKNMSFDKTDLTGAIIKAASLNGSTFDGATLKDATISASDLRNAKFDGADLTGLTIKASGLKGASFVGARLIDTKFSKSEVSGISFEGQTLTRVIFDSSSLKNTSFKDAVLQDVSFHYSAVKQAIFDGTTMDQITYNLLQAAGAILNDCHIK